LVFCTAASQNPDTGIRVLRADAAAGRRIGLECWRQPCSVWRSCGSRLLTGRENKFIIRGIIGLQGREEKQAQEETNEAVWSKRTSKNVFGVF